MDTRERARRFSTFVGLELKGKITARGFTAKAVAAQTGHSASALNKWLNGGVELPLTVLIETCEMIGVQPGPIVDVAYERLVAEHSGEGVVTPLSDVGAPDQNADMPAAAKKGRRKSDVDPAE